MMRTGGSCLDCGAPILPPPPELPEGAFWRVNGQEWGERFLQARAAHRAATGHEHYQIAYMWFEQGMDAATAHTLQE